LTVEQEVVTFDVVVKNGKHRSTKILQDNFEGYLVGVNEVRSVGCPSSAPSIGKELIEVCAFTKPSRWLYDEIRVAVRILTTLSGSISGSSSSCFGAMTLIDDISVAAELDLTRGICER
jgi:hypothetical protein